MKIYFCEKCGASVPLQEVVAGRATSSDGSVFCNQHMPGAADGDLKLYFCDDCGVSIPLQDVITGTAQTGGDRTACASCARRKTMEQSSEDRFQLYFCDSCNTSVPQSHVITGRALVRGGKTFCENCRDRATKGMSPMVPVVAVLALAAIAVALVLVFGQRGEDGPPAASLEQLQAFEKSYGEKLEGMANGTSEDFGEIDRRLREASESLARDIGKLEAQVADLGRQAQEKEALARKVAELQSELDRLKPLEEKVAKVDEMKRQIEQLTFALAEKIRADQARPEPAAPERAPEPEPAKPAADLPEPVRALIERLGSPDSGIRFSAAVDLGKAKHPAAVDPLAKLLGSDEDLFVRRGAAKALGEIKDRRAVPALIESLTDSEIYVSLQAAKSLRVITGKEFGFRENLSMAQRRQIQGKWKKWWSANSGK